MGRVKEFFSKFKEWLKIKLMLDISESEDPLNRKYLRFLRNRIIFWIAGIAIIIVVPTAILMLTNVSPDRDFFIFIGSFSAFFTTIMLLDLWIIALYYISEDSKRRNMSPTLWVIACIIVPYLLGFLLYFLVRRPLPLTCPNCRKIIPNGSKFCPECGFNITKNCPKCEASIPEKANYCPQCGSPVKALK